MKILKEYKKFLKDNKINKNNINDFDFFLDNIMSLPTNEIVALRDDIKKMIKEEYINENVSSFLDKLKRKYGSWFDDKLFKFLINRKKNFYIDLVDKLNLFDLSTLDDVIKAFPGLKIKSLYLAGGMDAAEDTGAGWRNTLEFEFEVENPGKKNPKLDKIKIRDLEIAPAYVVDGKFLDLVLIKPNEIKKLYDQPMIFNPVRKEEDRNKSDEFDKSVDKMKEKDWDPIENPEPLQFFRKTFSKSIEPDDEHLLRLSSAVFLGMDSAAGAGTYGELELLSLIRKPLFAWLMNSHDNYPGGFKLWNIPHLSKIMRTQDDMKTFVKTILKYT